MGTQALVWAVSWGIVRESLGRDPMADEVAEWWGESRSTGFREQAAFRKAFPMLKNPGPIIDSGDQVRAYVRELVRRFKDAAGFEKAGKQELDQVAVDLGLLAAT
jgi:hypothetical protein